MRLSEMIRLGSMLTEQCRGTMHTSFAGHEFTCAMGAAKIGCETSNVSLDKFDYLLSEYVENPITHELGSVIKTIIDLNDKQDWTREKIADWLETIETKLEEKSLTNVEEKEFANV